MMFSVLKQRIQSNLLGQREYHLPRFNRKVAVEKIEILG